MKTMLTVAKYFVVIVAVAVLGVLSARQVGAHLSARKAEALARQAKLTRRQLTEELLRSMNTVAVGGRLPDHQFRDLQGDPFRLSELDAEPVLLVVFHPSCGFCDKELAAIRASVSDPSLHARFLLVSAGDLAGVNEKKEQFDIRSRVLHDQDGAYLKELGVTTFPFNIVVGKDREVRDVLAASLDSEDLAQFIATGALE
jgi:peroxiredoxin